MKSILFCLLIFPFVTLAQQKYQIILFDQSHAKKNAKPGDRGTGLDSLLVTINDEATFVLNGLNGSYDLKTTLTILKDNKRYVSISPRLEGVGITAALGSTVKLSIKSLGRYMTDTLSKNSPTNKIDTSFSITIGNTDSTQLFWNFLIGNPYKLFAVHKKVTSSYMVNSLGLTERSDVSVTAIQRRLYKFIRYEYNATTNQLTDGWSTRAKRNRSVAKFRKFGYKNFKFKRGERWEMRG
jgi:hypothetical protein